MWFGTSASEVQILSPQPFFSIYIEFLVCRLQWCRRSEAAKAPEINKHHARTSHQAVNFSDFLDNAKTNSRLSTLVRNNLWLQSFAMMWQHLEEVDYRRLYRVWRHGCIFDVLMHVLMLGIFVVLE